MLLLLKRREKNLMLHTSKFVKWIVSLYNLMLLLLKRREKNLMLHTSKFVGIFCIYFALIFENKCLNQKFQKLSVVPRRLIFLVFPFSNTFNLFKNYKRISVSIITRKYHNQWVDANSLYKIMVKVVLHLNVSAPLRPNNSGASPGLVPVVCPGVRCLDHPRS
jgi:hypothetical protein